MIGLDTLLGQDETVRELRREKAAGRRAHAYLFEGPLGTGRLTMARAWAAELWCLDPDRPGCGVCRPCRLLASGAHADYLELPRGGRELGLARFLEGATASKNDPVDHPPALPFLQLKPVEAPFRIVVVPDAERMRVESANAFLKTLEEPPGGSVILLTTNARDRLPATIVSRCRRVRVRPLPEMEVIRALLADPAAGSSAASAPGPAAGRGRRRDEAAVSPPPPLDEAAARSLAALSEGSLGFARRLATEGETLAHWEWLGTALAARDAAGAWRLARGFVERLPAAGATQAPRRAAAAALLDLAALRLRRRWREEAWDARGVYAALDAVASAGAQIAANVNPDLVLTAASFAIVAALRRFAG